MFRGMCLLLMVDGWGGKDKSLDFNVSGSVGPGLKDRLLSMSKFRGLVFSRQ
jgi:hypothetical protein